MNDVAANASAGLQQAWASILLFFPKLLMFVAILGIGYFVAKFLCKIVNRVLDRTGFDRLVERGGIRKALEKSAWDASDIVGKLVFYFVMLFTLQLAFGVFGPNPVSALLTGIIAYLPNILAAGLIIIVAAFCVMNTLITVTVQKRRDIGVMKALMQISATSLGMTSAGISVN